MPGVVSDFARNSIRARANYLLLPRQDDDDDLRLRRAITDAALSAKRDALGCRRGSRSGMCGVLVQEERVTHPLCR